MFGICPPCSVNFKLGAKTQSFWASSWVDDQVLHLWKLCTLCFLPPFCHEHLLQDGLHLGYRVLLMDTLTLLCTLFCEYPTRIFLWWWSYSGFLSPLAGGTCWPGTGYVGHSVGWIVLCFSISVRCFFLSACISGPEKDKGPRLRGNAQAVPWSWVLNAKLFAMFVLKVCLRESAAVCTKSFFSRVSIHFLYLLASFVWYAKCS